MHEEVFKPGARLSFTTDSPLYPDVYEAEILEAHPDRLDLYLSLHHGYLLLIPVGTKIRWLVSGYYSEHLISEVIARDTSKKIWSVTLPKTSSELGGRTRVIAVASGKGGVGKTSLSINLSLAMSYLQKRVILLDADIGMANVEVLLGLHSYYNLSHVIEGECSLKDIILEGPGGIKILPGYSGVSSLSSLNTLQFNRIIAGFDQLEEECDILMLDTGAGMAEPVLKFIEASDDFILLTSPEPHALMDGYALLKVLSQRNSEINVNMIINNCESRQEAIQCRDRFTGAAESFLGVNPLWLGWLPETHLASRAIKQKHPVYLSHPKAEYSRQVEYIAKKLLGMGVSKKQSNGIKGFLKRLKKDWLN